MTVDYPGLWVAGGVLTITVAAALMTWQWHSPGVFFALLVVMALIAAVLYSLANPVPESEVGGLLIGTLISAFTLIMGWLYGANRRPPPEAPARPIDVQSENSPSISKAPPEDEKHT
jgi:hypothetical protein